MTKICENCGEEFEARDKRQIVCRKPECIKYANRKRYASKAIERTCKNCGIVYKALPKQSKELCHTCASSIGHKNKKYEQVQVNIRCKDCGKIVRVELHNYVESKYVSDIYTATCDDCKQINKQRVSDNMKLKNPTYEKELTWDEYLAKQYEKEQKELKKEELKIQHRLEASERMKINNPMRDPNTVEKMCKTMSERRASGKIKDPKGKDRWNYRGATPIKRMLRCELKQWRKNELARANYKCEICGKSHCYLHIHHLEKFDTIIKNFASELEIDLATVEYLSDDYNKLAKKVVDYHNSNKIGIVVCPDCHDKLDECYHKPKKKEEEFED